MTSVQADPCFVMLIQDVRKAVLVVLPACETMVSEIVARTRDINHEVCPQSSRSPTTVTSGACEVTLGHARRAFSDPV